MPSSVRRFARRARQRRLRAAMPWLIAAAVLVVGGIATGVVYTTGLFGITRVVVLGADVSTPQEVQAAAAVRRGTPLARVDLHAVSRRVEHVLAVRHATVRRTWPHTLTVIVVERAAVAVVPDPDGGFVEVDDSGVAFAWAIERPPGLPLVRLTGPATDDPTTRAALRVLLALPPDLRTPLVELVAEAPTRIRLELTGARTVVWGDATENAAKARVAVSLLAGPATVLDVSAPDVVTVR
jgi:cell division protein FtsQ